MRYFYSPGTCSLAGMAALEIARAEYQAVEVALAGDRAELRAVSLEGKVPTLVDRDVVILDTVAIIYWLARRFPAAGLLPLDESETALALSKMAWFGNVFHLIRRRFARPIMFSEDPDAHSSIRVLAATEYQAALQKVDGWLAERQWPLAVEVYALVFYNWAILDEQPVGSLESYHRLVARLVARGDVRRALARHRSPLLNEPTPGDAHVPA